MKKIFLAFFTFLIVVSFCSCSCSHEWQEASCSVPQTCLKCGETFGVPLTHVWQEASCTSPRVCLLCGVAEGDVLPHEWLAPSCTEAKTCFSCGLTEGGPLGHSWVDATCTTPETCSVCKEQNGVAPGHFLTETVTVIDASCTSPGSIEGVCSICKSTFTQETPLLEHTPSDWKITLEATYDDAGITAILCSECEAVIEEKSYELTDEEKENWYKKVCQTIAYEDIARNPNDYIGQRVRVTGEVIWCHQEASSEKDYSVYMIYTKKSYGYYLEDMFSIVIYNYDQPRILSGDIITFYGEVTGLMDEYGESYPCLEAIYYDIK